MGMQPYQVWSEVHYLEAWSSIYGSGIDQGKKRSLISARFFLPDLATSLFFWIFLTPEASMKSEDGKKKNENRKMKTPVYDDEEGKSHRLALSENLL